MQTYRRTVTIAGAALLGATAFIISALRLEVPFFPLTYLKFDLTEIPDFLSYLLFGFRWGIMTSLIHFLVLSTVSGNVLGASMKLIAVISMMLGYWIFSSKLKGNKAYILGSIGGVILRVIVMSLFNIIILWILFPQWLDYAYYLLNLFGFNVKSKFEVLIWTIILTAIYNTIHTILTVALSIFIHRVILKVL